MRNRHITNRRIQLTGMQRTPLTRGNKHWVSAVLTFTGGFVDIVGYIVVAQIFTANMTGNTIHIGQFAANLHKTEFLPPAIALFSFVFGLLIGRIIIEIGARRRIASIASWTLAVEGALLTATALIGRPYLHFGKIPPNAEVRYCLIALLATAMGIQNATLSKLGPLTIYTTFVTGTLTKFAQRFSLWLFRAYDLKEFSLRRAFADCEFRDSAFLLAIWVCYLLGAIAGGFADRGMALDALWIPLVIVALMIPLDQRYPMSLEEERE